MSITENASESGDETPGSGQIDKYGNKVTNMQDFDPDGDIMDPQFALFNSHKNDAHSKAKADFIRIEGQDDWDEYIQPIEDEGIMAIFNQKPTCEGYWFVMRVTMYVNENMSFEMDDEIITFCPAWHKETMERFDENN